MDFDFTEEQNALRDAVARWVGRDFPFERRHALARAGGASRAVYAELAALGLTGLAVPEAQGGLGYGPVEAMVVMEELGRGLVHAPYASAALVAPALLAAAPPMLQAHWLPRIAGGEALVVLAHQERAARLKDLFTEYALPVMQTPSHIVPVMVGDPRCCKEGSDLLLEQHSIYVQPINYPTVPKGKERFRFTPSPLHTDQMMHALASALNELWTRMHLERAA